MALRRNVALAGAAVLLAGLAVYPWVAPLPGPPAEGEVAGTERPPPAAAALPPLASFAAVFERPLFSPSRRPPATAAPAPALDSGLERRYRLLGVVDAGGARRAFVADGKRRLQIVEGAALDGWTVTRIEHDRVVLTKAGAEAALELRHAGSEAGEAPAAAASAR